MEVGSITERRVDHGLQVPEIEVLVDWDNLRNVLSLAILDTVEKRYWILIHSDGRRDCDETCHNRENWLVLYSSYPRSTCNRRDVKRGEHQYGQGTD